jgi:hypothetical protein
LEIQNRTGFGLRHYAFTNTTFLLHLSKASSQPVLLSVIEPGVIRPIFEHTLTGKSSGIIPVTVPRSSPGLEIGKTYILTAGILCNPQRRSQSAYTRIMLKRVALTPLLEEKLSKAVSKQERAQIFAQAGIWYDAIASSYTAMKPENSGAQAERDF